MYNITKLTFSLIVAFYIYGYFKNKSKYKIINEYKQKLNDYDDKKEKLRILSIKLDKLALFTGVVSFVVCVSNNVFIIIITLIIVSIIILLINNIKS